MPNLGKNRQNDKAAREERRHQVSSLYRQGLSMGAIAASLGCAQSTVHQDIQVLKERWRKSADSNFVARLGAELARLEGVEHLAYEGWNRSLSLPPPSAGGANAAPPAGDPRFLHEARRCIELRLRAQGAISGARVKTTVQVEGDAQVSIWDRIANAVSRSREPDPVEEAIAAAGRPVQALEHRQEGPSEAPGSDGAEEGLADALARLEALEAKAASRNGTSNGSGHHA